MGYKKNDFLGQLLLSELMPDDSGELVQVLPEENQHKMSPGTLPDELSILPIRNAVLFPGVVMPITVGRIKSIKLVKKAYRENSIIGVLAQNNNQVDDPTVQDLYETGTLAKIIKMIVLPDGNTTIIIQGKNRFKIESYIKENPYFTARTKLLKDKSITGKKKEIKAVVGSLKDAASKILSLSSDIPQEAQMAIDNITEPEFLTYFLSSNLNADIADKQQLLELNDSIKRATLLLEYMLKEVQMLELKHEIHKKVHTDIDQQQRDYYLRQQMKVLQDELGYDGVDQEVEELRKKAKKKKWPEAIAKHFNKELDKLLRFNPSAAEYPVTMNYVEFLLELPWEYYTKDNFNLKRAKKILDQDHYGLDKVKERIIEYLAVLKLKQDMKGPILCLYGPPGVGKTSLGKSIAKALKRKYVRMSLGGVHDEAEIRGHRKTYVGALPGKIIQNIKKAGASNPVFILDEIDKVSADFRGNPAFALLEVLDPEQNSTFGDNYLEVNYDLSKTLFIATANSLETINPALRDRMEAINVSGYTLEEKVEISKKHLVPKQLEEHGLKRSDMSFTKNSIAKLVDGYTRESGVRSLERKIGSVVRNTAKNIAMEEPYHQKVNANMVIEILGTEIFDKELYQDNDIAGVATGLAWTQVGGEILFIESSLNKGKGKLTLSGQLGDVMKESAVAALSYLKSNADQIEIDYRLFDHYDLHVHIPAGAVPKDGPSAGITMLTSLASLYTQRRIKGKLAMTGEITLRGKVLPVGGIKEKILAARRAGIKELILCEKNKRDISEIDEIYVKDFTIHYVQSVHQVLELALLKEQVKKSMKFTFPEKENTK